MSGRGALSALPRVFTEQQAAATWAALRQAIQQIQNGNASVLRFEELYRSAYTLVLNRHGELLYAGVTECVEEKLQQVARVVSGAAAENLLETIVKEWEQHKIIMTMIRDILMYMDKQFCQPMRRPLIYAQGLELFQRLVVRGGSVSLRLKEVLLEQVQRERNGEAIDRQLLKKCLSMMVEVSSRGANVYVDDFESEFLQQTRQFYQHESQEFMVRNTVPEYLAKVEQRLAEEEERADTYLDKSTRKALLAAVVDELISKHAAALVQNEDSGATVMLERSQTADLARIYRLFSRDKETLGALRAALSALVRESGNAIIKDQENVKNPKVFVQEVLKCRAKFQDIVDAAFERDRDFERVLREALETFINQDSRTAQYLSLFVDDMMKSGLKGQPEQEVEARLTQVMSVFRYLQDKDVFEDYYKQHLAGRLLSGSSANHDVEMQMINKLKTECGHQFTSRIEGMFRDMDLSRQNMTGYQNWLSKLRAPEADLQVTVLTTGFWPVVPAGECKLPQPAEEMCRTFTQYYQHVYNGRRLTWQTNLGTAELRCKFHKGRKELVVPTFQMCILMLYNHGDVFTFRQIQELTRISEAELGRHLLSLAHPKVHILVKTPNTRALADDHKFSYNMAFTSKLFRIKVPVMSQSVAAAAVKAEVPEAVMEARKNRVEAAIVRVMKSRKTLDHNNLVAEVVKQLTQRFSVDPSFIKKRIESLIEREYLERDANDRRVYHYLA